MRHSLTLLVLIGTISSAHAQNFPTALQTTREAVVCKTPEGLSEGAAAYKSKDHRSFQRNGCRVLRAGMQVRVEYAQRVGREDYHLIRIGWRRGPSMWAYSYDFK